MAKEVVHTSPYTVYAQRHKDGRLVFGPEIIEASNQTEARDVAVLKIGSVDKLRKVNIFVSPLR